MALNIKNDRVSRLAHELASLTGDSITDSVGYAIEARLNELRREGDRRRVAQQLIAIGKRCAGEAPADWRTHDFDEELYNEQGLPR